MPEGQRTQPFGDSFAQFRLLNQTLAGVQKVLQKSFGNPVAGMFGLVINGGVEFVPP